MRGYCRKWRLSVVCSTTEEGQQCGNEDIWLGSTHSSNEPRMWSFDLAAWPGDNLSADSLNPSDKLCIAHMSPSVSQRVTHQVVNPSSKSRLWKPFCPHWHLDSHCMPRHQLLITCSFPALWKVACYLHSNSRPVLDWPNQRSSVSSSGQTTSSPRRAWRSYPSLGTLPLP